MNKEKLIEKLKDLNNKNELVFLYLTDDYNLLVDCICEKCRKHKISYIEIDEDLCNFKVLNDLSEKYINQPLGMEEYMDDDLILKCRCDTATEDCIKCGENANTEFPFQYNDKVYYFCEECFDFDVTCIKCDNCENCDVELCLRNSIIQNIEVGEDDATFSFLCKVGNVENKIEMDVSIFYMKSESIYYDDEND